MKRAGLTFSFKLYQPRYGCLVILIVPFSAIKVHCLIPASPLGGDGIFSLLFFPVVCGQVRAWIERPKLPFDVCMHRVFNILLLLGVDVLYVHLAFPNPIPSSITVCLVCCYFEVVPD